VREIGTIAALDLAAEDAGYLAGIGPRFRPRRAPALAGNTIYVMPPFCPAVIAAYEKKIADLEMPEADPEQATEDGARTMPSRRCSNSL
jgi:hypothetical protein